MPPPASPGPATGSAAAATVTVTPNTLTTPDGQRGATQRRFRQRTEATRERDVFRHLLAWEETYKPKSLRRSAFADAGGISDALSTRMCPDTALAAFAQLITLRLRARRCLISLVATDDEFVLADMTKTTPLQHDGHAIDSKDQSWIGTRNFRRQQGVNHEAVDEWRKARRMRQVPEDHDHYYVEELSPHWSLIKDARHHARRQELALLRNGPWIRSCISVPLRGAQGSVLGAITVLDERPRYGISAEEMNFLEDISDTTVEHLNATIARCQRQRGERLIQALGTFNNGKSSLREWWLGQDDARILAMGRHAEKGGMTERQARSDAEFGVQHSAATNGFIDEPTVSQSREGRSQSRPTRQPVELTHSNNSIEPTVPTSDPGQLKLSVTPRQAVPDKRTDTDDLALSSSGAYARASNLLREATGVDGVVFADASTVFGSFRQYVNNDAESNRGDRRSQDDADSQTRRSEGESSDSSSAAEASRICDVLAFANRNRSSLAGYRPETQPFPLQEHHLQRLISRYPAGVLFHFDNQGQSFASSDDGSQTSSNEEWDTERKRRSRDARLLSKAIKGVRTVALYPLWDDSIDRYRSCMFVWSTHSDRYFDREEQLTYLKAFGHSLVAQLSRLESLETDKAKTTFMSSISHETRSPLHGIMAGVEFLQESELSQFQEEMVHAISMAGRTLLDTMDHILDYSKISKHSQGQMSPRRGAKHNGRLRPGSPKLRIDEVVPNTDLARLTEEVVETTVAAFRPHSKAPLSPQSSRNSANFPSPASTIPDDASEVSVLLNVDFRKNWVVKVPPGAWTRILTNLLGNALKYTRKGQISVRLEVGSPSSRGSSQTAPIQLVVEDTGIGISEAFQAHGLYMPFKQEDCHAQGTGLGLSIVKQLARDIGATMSLKSKRGRGTRVTLGFSAEFANEESVRDSAFTADLMPEGLTVDQFHLLSPTAQGMPGDLPMGKHLGDSVLEIAEEWLHCNALQGPDITKANGTSVCAMTEEQLNFLETKSPGLLEDLLDRAAEDHSHLLILGRSIHSLSFDQRAIHTAITPVFVHQPIGPRKLLRAIASDRSSSSQQLDRLRSPTSVSLGDPISRALEEARSPFSPQTPRTINSKLAPPSQPTPLEPSDGDESTQPSQSARSSADKISTLEGSNDSASTAPTSAIGSSSASCGDTTPEGEECILLVEDNDVNMKLLVAFSKKLNLGYECATNGQEALDLYRATPNRFFLILMDMSMPIVDGFAATAQIREHEKKIGNHRTFIAALTGATTDGSRKRAFDFGVDEYYAKPVRMADLRKLVSKIRDGW